MFAFLLRIPGLRALLDRWFPRDPNDSGGDGRFG